MTPFNMKTSYYYERELDTRMKEMTKKNGD